MRFLVAVVLCGALMSCGDDGSSAPFHADDVEAAMRADAVGATLDDDVIDEQIDYLRGLCTDELDLETQYGIAAAVDGGGMAAVLLEIGCPGRVAEVLRP